MTLQVSMRRYQSALIRWRDNNVQFPAELRFSGHKMGLYYYIHSINHNVTEVDLIGQTMMM